jgi:hypothetical protein
MSEMAKLRLKSLSLLDASYPTRPESFVNSNNNQNNTSHNNTFEVPKRGIFYNKIRENKTDLDTYYDEDSKKLLYDDKYNNLINSSLESLNSTIPRLALKHTPAAIVHTNEDFAPENDS